MRGLSLGVNPLAEYLNRLRARESLLRRGYTAVNKCVREGEPDPILEPLYVSMGVFSTTIRRYGEALKPRDPALWLYARQAGGPEEASRLLRRASDNIRELDAFECRGVPEEAVDEATSTLRVVSSLWRSTRTVMARLALALTM